MSQALSIERSIYPYAVVLQTIPVLALVLLVGSVFGYDFTNLVLVVVLIALFSDHHEHAVRPAVGRPGSARPLQPAQIGPRDPLWRLQRGTGVSADRSRLVRPAVEEALRWVNPALAMARVALSDFSLRGSGDRGRRRAAVRGPRRQP